MEIGRQADSIVKNVGAGGPYVQAWLTGNDTLAGMGTAITRPYAQHPTVYTAIKRKASAIGQLEIEAWPKGADRKKDKPIANHWLPELLKMPSPYLRGQQLIEGIETFMQLKGEAWLYHDDIRRGGAGNVMRPHALALLDPDRMTPRKDRAGNVIGWSFSSAKGGVPLDPEELTFPHYFNPYDQDRGLGPLRAALVEYTGDHSYALWNRAFVQNSAIPPILFLSDKEWPEEDRKAFIADWNKKFGGPTKSGTAAAPPTGVKAEVLKMTQQEMEFFAGRKFHREQILSIFGVPPAIAGVFDSPAYVSAPKEQKKFFWLVTLMPDVLYLQTVLTEMVQRYEPDVAIFFKYEPVLADILADDYTAKVETAAKLMGWGWSPASINEAMNLGLPTAGQPWLEEGYLPYSLVLAKDVISGATFATPPDPGAPAPAADPNADPEATPPGKRAARMNEVQKTAVWRNLIRVTRDLESRAESRWRDHLNILKIDVLKRLAATKAAAGVEKKDEPSKPPSSPDPLLFDPQSARQEAVINLEPIWRASIGRGVDTVARQIGAAIDFAFTDPEVLNALVKRRVQIKNTTDRIRRDLRATLQEGITATETEEDLKQRVLDFFDGERANARTVARTETFSAFSEGRFFGMKEADVQEQEWLTARDDLVRDEHVKLDGERVKIGDPFSNGLQYPLDPTAADPGEVINCRCVTLPIV